MKSIITNKDSIANNLKRYVAQIRLFPDGKESGCYYYKKTFTPKERNNLSSIISTIEAYQGSSRGNNVPSADFIGMVTKDQFNNLRNEDATQLYYATLLHEITHWTSHKDRCDRQYKEKYFENFKSNETYAFEELVAELGMFMSLDRVSDKDLDKKQIYNNVGNYLKSWLSHDNTKAKKIEKLMIASELSDYAERYIFDPK